MYIPYQVLDVRFTQAGWVMDCMYNSKAILPVSILFDYHELYTKGFVMNSRRATIKALFEMRLSEIRRMK